MVVLLESARCFQSSLLSHTTCVRSWCNWRAPATRAKSPCVDNAYGELELHWLSWPHSLPFWCTLSWACFCSFFWWNFQGFEGTQISTRFICISLSYAKRDHWKPTIDKNWKDTFPGGHRNFRGTHPRFIFQWHYNILQHPLLGHSALQIQHIPLGWTFSNPVCFKVQISKNVSFTVLTTFQWNLIHVWALTGNFELVNLAPVPYAWSLTTETP